MEHLDQLQAAEERLDVRRQLLEHGVGHVQLCSVREVHHLLRWEPFWRFAVDDGDERVCRRGLCRADAVGALALEGRAAAWGGWHAVEGAEEAVTCDSHQLRGIDTRGRTRDAHARRAHPARGRFVLVYLHARLAFKE